MPTDNKKMLPASFISALNSSSEIGELDLLITQNLKSINSEIEGDGGNSPLHLAVANKNIPAIKRLLKAKPYINVNAINKSKLTPLGMAVEMQEVEIINLLLEAGADLEQPYGDYPIDSNFRTSFTPLQHSIILGSEEIGKILLQRGANVNNRAGRLGNTPLHYAVAMGNLLMMQLLIERHANVNLQSRDGMSPLQFGISQLYPKIDGIKILLKNKADLYLVDQYGNNIFHDVFSRDVLSRKDSLDCVEYLFQNLNTQEKNVLLSMKNHYGYMPIEAAAFRGRIHEVEFLMNQMDAVNLNELCLIAAKQGHVQFVERFFPRLLEEKKNGFLLELINHPKKTDIEEIANQYNNGFGNINYEGAQIALAHLMSKRGDNFYTCLLNSESEYPDLIKSLKPLLDNPDISVRIQFIIPGIHWRVGDIKIEHGSLSVCFIDSLGKFLDESLSECFLAPIYQICSEPNIYEIEDPRQTTGKGCSLFDIDDVSHLHIVDQFLPKEYEKTGFYGYLADHQTKVMHYGDRDQYTVINTRLPFYMNRTRQSIKGEASSSTFWQVPCYQEELSLYTKKGDTLEKSLTKSILPSGEGQRNQRLVFKLKRLCEHIVNFMVYTPSDVFAEKLDHVTLTGCQQQLQKLANSKINTSQCTI